ncbi:DNA-directed RNA polymerase subunit delta [Virgibacillus oceani]|uniref:Probable DNA-directed RNA polymerase subunit delta n=1 Tax=Virgibacillus oceani TaxID=1479511 RepID=A0A917HSG5_9BACI|nr:DNA-directed RNA polymerase subunit delta [Virgibacillus oceani]GGG87820.1 hypothetical protein GCM10011398_37160 [Virgibacillus oceani]
MSLNNYSHEEISKMSMIDLANLILLEEKKALNFKDIYEKIAELKGFNEEEKHDNIAQFYTDLNINGHFMTIGSNMWGLKRWYPVEQIDEEITAVPKKKKKKAPKKKAPKKEETFEAEEELEIDDDDIEVLTGNFKEDDDENDGFDEEFDDEIDEIDDDESYEDDDEEYGDDEDEDYEEEEDNK